MLLAPRLALTALRAQVLPIFNSANTNRSVAVVRRATMASAAPNSYMALIYDYVPDILDRRGPFRAQHLEGAAKMVSKTHVQAMCTIQACAVCCRYTHVRLRHICD
jgi:hypothetical protein